MAAQPQDRLLHLLDATAPRPVSQLGDLRLLHANLQVQNKPVPEALCSALHANTM